MNLEEYKKKFEHIEGAAPGMDAIDQAFEKLYPGKELKYFNAEGDEPLDGVGLYFVKVKRDTFYHLISYGFSSLFYDEDSVGEEYSKLGFELTFRLKPYSLDDGEPLWAVNLMQSIASYVFNNNKRLNISEYIPTNGPIRQKCDTAIAGLIFIKDPSLGTIDTPHGKIDFLQMFGITGAELEDLKSEAISPEELLAELSPNNPLLITDLDRK